MKKKFAIGIPSYNEAEQISFVLKQIDQGICKYFNPSEFVVFNLDSNSSDGTKEVFLKTKITCFKKYLETPPGKGRAMLMLFKYCVKNNIPYVATIDADLKSIKPDWVYKLLMPITKGYDFVIPVYTRNRFKANITNHFAYPIILANYGIELRQPLGGEFGYSFEFCKYLLSHPKYSKTYQYGIDIFISCCSLFGGFKIKETYLGKKIDAPSFYHMESTFRQVSESGIFTTRCHRKESFKFGKISENKKASGIDESKNFPHKETIPKLKRQLARRFFKYQDQGLYQQFVANQPLIKRIAVIMENGDLSSLDENLWTDYLASVLKKCYQKNFDLGNLKIVSRINTPIYRWRVMTYWLLVENLKSEEAERIVKKQAFLLKNKLNK